MVRREIQSPGMNMNMTRHHYLTRTFSILALLLAATLATACGGGSGGDDQGDQGDLQLAGPFVIDFESPAADTTPEVEPFDVGSNVTMSSLSNLFIWSNAQGWGVTDTGCNAALEGSQGIGSDDDSSNQTIFADFASPVASVELRVAAAVGTTIIVEALDAHGGIVDTASTTAPACPGPMSLVRLVIAPTTNSIHRVRINGDVPVIDNLTWFRFQ